MLYLLLKGTLFYFKYLYFTVVFFFHLHSDNVPKAWNKKLFNRFNYVVKINSSHKAAKLKSQHIIKHIMKN